MSTKEQKAVIHILKNKYNISDETYRTLLFDNFEEFSSVDLTEEQAEQFIHKLNYNNNDDYKCGYDKAFNEFIKHGSNLYDVFNQKLLNKYNRQPTKYETEMFNLLDNEKKISLIKSL